MELVTADGEQRRNPRSQASQASQATEIVTLAHAADVELFHDPAKVAYAAYAVDGHRETAPLTSRAFRDWLAWLYYRSGQTAARAPSAAALNDAISSLGSEARYAGATESVHLRLAEHEGRIYLDLADDVWRAVEIDSDGWRVIDDPPVRFRRTPGMLPLPAPVRGGTPAQLGQLLGVRDDAAKLLTAWLLAALRPRGPYPLLEIGGEAGSGKSTRARMLRDLLDPATAPLRAAPRNEQDLMIAANNGWILALDNLSRLPPWLSDGLCRLSTGGGFATRELYTAAEETIFAASRPVLITGIEPVAYRGDLLDRSLLVSLDAIPTTSRRTEAEMDAEFAAARPALLGVLLDAVAVALRNLPHVQLTELPRMADFARWIIAAEPALTGRNSTEMLDAYQRSRAEADQLAIDASEVGKALLAMLRGTRGWHGTPTALFAALKGPGDASRTPLAHTWPANAQLLSGHLKRLAPHLRKIGWDVQTRRNKTARTISITPTPVTGVGMTAVSSQPSSSGGDARVTRVTRQCCRGDATGAVAALVCDASAALQLDFRVD